MNRRQLIEAMKARFARMHDEIVFFALAHPTDMRLLPLARRIDDRLWQAGLGHISVTHPDTPDCLR